MSIKKILAKISEDIEDCPETIFDSFNVSLNSALFGSAMKERLGELTQQNARIRQLCTHAMLRFKGAENRRDAVTALAWESVDKSLKVTQQRILVKTTPVEIEGETTTINDEEQRMNLYEYVYERGKDKLKEVSGSLDAARSMLSWDKEEYNKGHHDG